MRSVIFVAVISLLIALHGGLHYYASLKVTPLLPGYRWPIIVTLTLLWLSLFATMFLTHSNGAHAMASPLAWLAFLWMGYVFLFFVLSAPVDFLGMLSGAAGWNTLQTQLAAPMRTAAIGVITLGVAGYGFFASHQINVEQVRLASPKLSQPVRIVQISDLHLGLLSSETYLRRMVETINSLQPDVVVVTGDLVDMQLDHLNGLGAQMAQIKARLGKFAVYGSHEAFAGLDASRAFIERSGLTLLSNSGVKLGDVINIVGVDDPAVENRVTASSVNEAALLADYANGTFTVLLKHQPMINPAARGHFDLQLSGHTHGGQIFPFGLLTQLVYRAPFGLSQAGPNAWLYVSRGTGTWGPPFRIVAPPEITLIELQTAAR